MRPDSDTTTYLVYYHIHRESGMGYVGVTSKTMERRWKQHVEKANAAKGKGSSFQGAIRMYGPAAFDHYVLEENVPAGQISEAERYWIVEKGTLDPYGYNLCEGGEGPCGYVHTEEELARMSAFQKEYHNRPEVKAKRSELSKKLWEDPEHRDKVLHKLKEANNRPDVKARTAAFHKEYQNRPEVKAAISAFQKEYKNRPEVKARKSEQAKAMWEDPEHAAAISAFHKEYQNRPEVKARTSDRSKKLWKCQRHRDLILNKKKIAGPTRGKYKGVCFAKDRNKWAFAIMVNWKLSRGCLPTEEQAARAYDDLARQHLGRGAYLNFPTDQEREDWLALKASLDRKESSL